MPLGKPRVVHIAGLFLVVLVAGCGGDREPVVTPPMREKALAGPDTAAMIQSLERILAWHERNGTGIPQLLNPGLDDATIDARFRELGCEPPADLRALWKWRNGHADNGRAQWLTWYHQFLPLDEAVAEYHRLRATPFLAWGRNWIPVLQFQTEWYFVVCGPIAHLANPLLVFMAEDGVMHPYTNLSSYFETMSRAMESGAVYAEGDPPDMRENIRDLAAIHRTQNPGLAFPYHVGD